MTVEVTSFLVGEVEIVWTMNGDQGLLGKMRKAPRLRGWRAKRRVSLSGLPTRQKFGLNVQREVTLLGAAEQHHPDASREVEEIGSAEDGVVDDVFAMGETSSKVTSCSEGASMKVRRTVRTKRFTNVQVTTRYPGEGYCSS